MKKNNGAHMFIPYISAKHTRKFDSELLLVRLIPPISRISSNIESNHTKHQAIDDWGLMKV